jgi:hypothetical protein
MHIWGRSDGLTNNDSMWHIHVGCKIPTPLGTLATLAVLQLPIYIECCTTAAVLPSTPPHHLWVFQGPSHMLTPQGGTVIEALRYCYC